MSKIYLYLAIIAGVAYLFFTYHYLPIQALKSETDSQKIVIDNLSVELLETVENNKVMGFEEYFKGKADENISISSCRLIF